MRTQAMPLCCSTRQRAARHSRRGTKQAFRAVKAEKSIDKRWIGRMRRGLYDLVDYRARERFEGKRQPL